MKPCPACHKYKQLTEFYKNAQLKEGYFANCKECTITASTKYRNDNLERVRGADRERKRAKAKEKKEGLNSPVSPHPYRPPIPPAKRTRLSKNHVRSQVSLDKERQVEYLQAIKRREENTAEAQEAARKWQEYLNNEMPPTILRGDNAYSNETKPCKACREDKLVSNFYEYENICKACRTLRGTMTTQQWREYKERPHE